MSPEIITYINWDEETKTPNFLQDRGAYGYKIDVYSYGVALWCLITRQRPYDDLRTISDIQNFVTSIS